MPHRTILVVEDNELLRQTIVETLQDEGFGVAESAGADEAENLLLADGFKLLITDVNMPGRMDGIDMAIRAHEREPLLPILFITGRPDALQRLRGSGVEAYSICKPFSLPTLVAAVRRMLAGKDEGGSTAQAGRRPD